MVMEKYHGGRLICHKNKKERNYRRGQNMTSYTGNREQERKEASWTLSFPFAI
jgi:hypothetical protein